MSETEDYSGFSKLCRITAHVIRLVNNITARSSKPVSPVGSGSLNSEEVLFRDMNGILRCKGRLCNSSLPESAKFPAWLPCDHHLTKLIIRDCHHKVMHNRARETLTELRSRFWLTKGLQVIRKQIYNCIVYRRQIDRQTIDR